MLKTGYHGQSYNQHKMAEAKANIIWPMSKAKGDPGQC